MLLQWNHIKSNSLMTAADFCFVLFFSSGHEKGRKVWPDNDQTEESWQQKSCFLWHRDRRHEHNSYMKTTVFCIKYLDLIFLLAMQAWNRQGRILTLQAHTRHVRDLNERKVFSVMFYTWVYHCFKRYVFCTDTFICGFSFVLFSYYYIEKNWMSLFFNKHTLKHELHISGNTSITFCPYFCSDLTEHVEINTQTDTWRKWMVLTVLLLFIVDSLILIFGVTCVLHGGAPEDRLVPVRLINM